MLGLFIGLLFLGLSVIEPRRTKPDVNRMAALATQRDLAEAAACAGKAAARPGASTLKSSVRLDVDGDGRLDEFSLCSVGNGNDFTWTPSHMRVRTASGHVIERLVGGWSGAKIIGTTDLNNDGRPEVWIFDGGATAHHVALVVFNGGRPAEVLSNDGGLDEFLFVATGLFAQGLTVGVECTDWDKNGTVDIVERTSQERVTKGVESPVDISEGWSYVVHGFDGAQTWVVTKAEGQSLRTEPKPDWDPGLNCDGVHRAGLGDI